FEFSESRTPSAVPPGGSRCRSRSNSWRARPCSILKEESEEELSSYMRSSRHSSRSASKEFVSTPLRGIRVPSRQSSLDEELFEEPRSASIARVLQPFEDLSPIAEHCPVMPRFTLSDSDENPSELVVAQRRAKFARSRSSATGASPVSVRSVFSKSDDSFAELQPPHRRQTYSGRMDLARRNSSPSISMFSGARDRVSPQAVQDLLELCRLGKGRRAASPESLRSSRSPSPPTSSGRASPGTVLLDSCKISFQCVISLVPIPSMSSLSSLSRLKVASSASGMRKLSSSPHLLGICEEGEDVETGNMLLTTGQTARTNRSASTGLVPMRHGSVQATKSTGSHPLPATYR
ncbi:unnamed protein product, partial [Strongylus vulgaris]